MVQDSASNPFNDITSSAEPLRAGRLSALSDLDAERQSDLAAALAASEQRRREQIARTLVDLGEDDATLNFDAVFALLLNDPSPDLRRLAIEGLWESADRQLIAPLLRLFREDEDIEVRAAAALALGRFVLLGEFGTLRPQDAESVRAGLREVAQDGDQPIPVRVRAIEAIGAASESWVQPLIWRAYDDDELSLQIAALHAMGRNSDPVWLPTLYAELESADPARRYEAAGAAGEIGDEDAVSHLEALADDPDPEVQEAAIRALGEIGGELALDALRSHLRSADPRVAEAVAAAIAVAKSEDGLIGSADLRVEGSGKDDSDDE